MNSDAKVNRGWIYREPATNAATPARIRVQIGKDLNQSVTKVFNDSPVGAQEAANFITSQIGDSWHLEDLAFLGYRIVEFPPPKVD